MSKKKSPPSREWKPRKGFGGAQPGAGRPRKVTREVLDRICEKLEQARFFDHACRLAGVTPEAVEKLMQADEEVRDRIMDAKAKGEEELISTLGDCIEGGRGPQGVQWWLERLYPKRYHLPKQLEVSGRDGGPQQVEVTQHVPSLSTAELLAKLPEALEKLKGSKT